MEKNTTFKFILDKSNEFAQVGAKFTEMEVPWDDFISLLKMANGNGFIQLILPMGEVTIKLNKNQPMVTHYKIKVDGGESIVDEEELVTNYQARKASDKKFQEASILYKKAKEIIDK